MCEVYVVKAFSQSNPFEAEKVIKEEWITWMTSMWINSQKDNEYFPIHGHINCDLSAVIYLKIPEYLPPRKSVDRLIDLPNDNFIQDGAIIFTNNVSQDQIWGVPTLEIQPVVGDFFIFPASQAHQVYPFRTADGKGERRSVSFNASFTSKTEQDTLRKQQEEQEAI